MAGKKLLLGSFCSGAGAEFRRWCGHGSRSGSIGRWSGSNHDRCGRYHDGCGSNGFFFFTAGNQGNSGNDGCQNEGLVHLNDP